MKIINIARITLGFLILSLLMYKIGLIQIIDVLKTTKIVYVIPAIVAFLSTLILNACKVDILLKSLGYKVSFCRLTKCAISAWAIGVITPAKLGEFSIIYFLKNEGINIGKGTAVSLLDRMISLSTISFFAIVGVTFYFTTKKALEFAVLSLILLIIGIILIKSEIIRDFIKKTILKKYSTNFRGFSKTFFFILNHRKGSVLANIIITTIKGMIGALVLYSLFLALDIHIAYYHIFFITAITSLLSLIPITISGLGIKEAGTVYLFGYLLGTSSGIAAGAAILNLIIKYISAAIAMFLFRKA